MPDFRAGVVGCIPHLRRYARALTKDADKADDLVQECLAKAIGRENQFQPGTNLRAWLFTILHNQFMDEMRRQAARPKLVAIDDNVRKLSDPPSQDATVELRRLEAALQELPVDQRIVTLLVGLEGMNYAEAAEVVGVPVGTVRSRLSRAREALRQMMEYEDLDKPPTRRPA